MSDQTTSDATFSFSGIVDADLARRIVRLYADQVSEEMKDGKWNMNLSITRAPGKSLKPRAVKRKRLA